MLMTTLILSVFGNNAQSLCQQLERATEVQNALRDKQVKEYQEQIQKAIEQEDVEKQRLAWELQVNVLQTQMKTIDEAFRASMITAGGAMLSGVLTIGLGAVGGETGLIAGQAVGHTAGGVMGLGAGVAQRQSDQDKAIADLQQNGAQSYNKSLTEIMEKATEIMQQIIGVGSSLVTVLAEILRALTR
ncbi:SPI-2 type III secretion system translocon protein SseD [Salmonella enterica subsp. enterica serovar Braenderup]|nr:SPI-2 type III secretion system translocon protein SseD [Salmonella enterica subsp. enterica serovar Braenderup]